MVSHMPARIVKLTVEAKSIWRLYIYIFVYISLYISYIHIVVSLSTYLSYIKMNLCLASLTFKFSINSLLVEC